MPTSLGLRAPVPSCPDWTVRDQVVWEVRLGPARAVTTRHSGGGSTGVVGALAEDADWVLDGPAAVRWTRPM